jgi:hypothetical protein
VKPRLGGSIDENGMQVPPYEIFYNYPPRFAPPPQKEIFRRSLYCVCLEKSATDHALAVFFFDCAGVYLPDRVLEKL